jgi:enoyl-CoA hydratase
MSVRIEKDGAVWTVIYDRPEACNAMDPDSADALTETFLEFDADDAASVAVFWGAGGAFCAGWDLKFVRTLNSRWASSTYLRQVRAETAARSRVAPSGPRGLNSTSLSLPQSRGLQWPVAWSSVCGAISG